MVRNPLKFPPPKWNFCSFPPQKKGKLAGESENHLPCKKWTKTNLGGGFIFFLFSPLFGEDFQFDSYFSNGLKPPTRNFLKKKHPKNSQGLKARTHEGHTAGMVQRLKDRPLPRRRRSWKLVWVNSFFAVSCLIVNKGDLFHSHCNCNFCKATSFF